MGFGLLEEGEVEVAGYVLRLKASGGSLVYERLKDGGGPEHRHVVSGGLSLHLVPSRPLLPSGVEFSCAMIGLETPVTVPPGGSLELSLEYPYDYAVVALGGGDAALVDYFASEAGVPKLSLHGDMVGGRLCRFYQSGLVSEARRGAASLRVEVSNRGRHAATIAKIVAPLEGLRIFYLPGSWEASYPGLSLEARNREAATATVLPGEPPPGYLESPIGVPGRKHARLPLRLQGLIG